MFASTCVNPCSNELAHAIKFIFECTISYKIRPTHTHPHINLPHISKHAHTHASICIVHLATLTDRHLSAHNRQTDMCSSKCICMHMYVVNT